MSRKRLLTEVARSLGQRALYWGGLRGDDARALNDLPNFEGSYSILASSGHVPPRFDFSFEHLVGERFDLETWDIQDHLRSEAGATFRRALLDQLDRPSALLPYRASQFLSSVCFARQATCVDLGWFGAHQAAFEHKPWVESSVASLEIPRVPWTYVAEEDQGRVRQLVERGPLMLRPSRTSGGEGMQRVDSPAELVAAWPRGEEGLVSIAPYLESALPVNLGATAWDDGVTVHLPSIQLVGLPSCVRRPFGYCGNDFVHARVLDPRILDQLEHSTVVLGDWLRRHGYRGTFGVDFLVHEDRALFMEVNPRFQGSSFASAALDREADESCVFLEHIAARLGLDPPTRRPLRLQVDSLGRLAHVVVHRVEGDARRVDAAALAATAKRSTLCSSVDVVPDPYVIVHPGAVVARIAVREPLTTSGFDLSSKWLRIIDDWHASNIESPLDAPEPT